MRKGGGGGGGGGKMRREGGKRGGGGGGGGGGGVVLRNCEERGKRGDGELVIVTGVTFLCRPFYDFPFSFFFHLFVKN